jgi:hypothetical protein
MEWNNFTKKYYNYFYLNKIIIKKNNAILLYAKNKKIKIKNFIKNNDYTINIIKLNNSIDDIITKYANEFFVSFNKVKKQLNNLNYNYLIEWDNNKIYIKSDNLNINNRIKILVYFIEYLKYISNNNKNITIYLVLTNLKKKYNGNTIINVDNVNSGYTDNHKNIIFIWRYEECEKVLFHELIHIFDIDRKYEKINLNIVQHHNYHEVITDYYGIIYHLIYISLITNKSIKSLLEIELSFIKNQCMLINNYFNLTSWEKKLPIIKQKTSAFSYYILKYMLFNYLITNNIILNNDINLTELFNELINIGLKSENYFKINSTRMTLFQLD